MKIKQKIQNTFTTFLMFMVFASISVATLIGSNAYAAEQCGGVQTAIISCDQSNKNATDTKETGLWGLLILTVNILIAGVGVLALAGIVYGAILYTSAGGSTEQIMKARTIFTNVVIGVIAFGGMYVLLNFLVPGGVFN